MQNILGMSPQPDLVEIITWVRSCHINAVHVLIHLLCKMLTNRYRTTAQKVITSVISGSKKTMTLKVWSMRRKPNFHTTIGSK